MAVSTRLLITDESIAVYWLSAVWLKDVSADSRMDWSLSIPSDPSRPGSVWETDIAVGPIVWSSESTIRKDRGILSNRSECRELVRRSAHQTTEERCESDGEFDRFVAEPATRRFDAILQVSVAFRQHPILTNSGGFRLT